MPEAISTFLWHALCALGSGMLAATLVRIELPHPTPERWQDLAQPIKGLLLLVGLLGGGLGYQAASLFGLFTQQLIALDPDNLWLIGLHLGVSSAAGALVGALLGQGAFVTDYHELHVALLDYSGAPLWMGGLIGGVLGA